MTTSRLTRFSISMDADLARQLDAMARERGVPNRSRAIADMVRAQLVEHHARAGTREIAGTITLVYDHHHRNLQRALTAIQHDHGPRIISTLHVHLSHHACMEVLAVRGPARAIQRLADQLIATRGVTHGRLAVTTTGGAHPA